MVTFNRKHKKTNLQSRSLKLHLVSAATFSSDCRGFTLLPSHISKSIQSHAWPISFKLWHNSLHLNQTKTWVQRTYSRTCCGIGSFPYNLIWLRKCSTGIEWGLPNLTTFEVGKVPLCLDTVWFQFRCRADPFGLRRPYLFLFTLTNTRHLSLWPTHGQDE